MATKRNPVLMRSRSESEAQDASAAAQLAAAWSVFGLGNAAPARAPAATAAAASSGASDLPPTPPPPGASNVGGGGAGSSGAAAVLRATSSSSNRSRSGTEIVALLRSVSLGYRSGALSHEERGDIKHRLLRDEDLTLDQEGRLSSILPSMSPANERLPSTEEEREQALLTDEDEDPRDATRRGRVAGKSRTTTVPGGVGSGAQGEQRSREAPAVASVAPPPEWPDLAAAAKVVTVGDADVKFKPAKPISYKEAALAPSPARRGRKWAQRQRRPSLTRPRSSSRESEASLTGGMGPAPTLPGRELDADQARIASKVAGAQLLKDHLRDAAASRAALEAHQKQARRRINRLVRDGRAEPDEARDLRRAVGSAHSVDDIELLEDSLAEIESRPIAGAAASSGADDSDTSGRHATAPTGRFGNWLRKGVVRPGSIGKAATQDVHASNAVRGARPPLSRSADGSVRTSGGAGSSGLSGAYSAGGSGGGGTSSIGLGTVAGGLAFDRYRRDSSLWDGAHPRSRTESADFSVTSEGGSSVSSWEARSTASSTGPASRPSFTIRLHNHYSVSAVTSDSLAFLDALRGPWPLRRPAFLRNSFRPRRPHKLNKLKPELQKGAKKLMSEPNAGGSSINSEAISVEMLEVSFNARLELTEMEVRYISRCSIADYVASIPLSLREEEVEPRRTRLGVSVTRAMKYRPGPEAFAPEDAERLLVKKLAGLQDAQDHVDPEHAWDRGLLHVWAQSDHVARVVRDTLYSLPSTLWSECLVLCTVSPHMEHVIFRDAADFDLPRELDPGLPKREKERRRREEAAQWAKLISPDRGSRDRRHHEA